ncbi:MAG: BMP family ABC transporter substrate-binding protein [Bacteroidota bacterium]
MKIGLVGGPGSFNDRGFNQQALVGILLAASTIPFDWEARESESSAQIDSNIRYFVRNNFDLVITLGYDAAEATMNAVTTHPSVKFLLLDYTFPVVPKNLVCVNYQVDQASFPCGFLAAWWATQKNAVNPKIAYVAGPNFSEIQQFTVSYTKGVEYFNTQYNKSVQVSGVNATAFNDTVQGARLADSLINQGADVVFACAGKTGNGALYKVKERAKYGIGVDVDQYISIPDVGPYLLTSCMKRLDRTIKAEVLNFYYGQYHGGQIIHCTLENQGVEMAPYHDYDPFIPSDIKTAIDAVKTGIMNGTIPTGWPQ